MHSGRLHKWLNKTRFSHHTAERMSRGLTGESLALAHRSAASPKRDESGCPAAEYSYTTPNGLVFQAHCGQQFDGDIGTIAQSSEEDVYECMASCSVNRPRCYAISYDASSQECNVLDANTSMRDRKNKDGVTVAVAHALQLQSPADLSCPYKNSTLQTSSSGEQFSVLCGVDFGGYGDYCPYSLGDYTDYDCPTHADSLSQCIDICSSVHPWCSGVSWNPDMESGYANCYLKNDLSGGSPAPPNMGGGVVHSAKVTAYSLASVSVSCPQNYTSTNGKSFDIHCYETRTGVQNITSVHHQSVQNCMDACASYNSPSCLGIVFDMGMIDGYENCYLLNSTGSPNGGANTTFAELSDRTDDTESSNGHHSSGSKAWIAGPIIGALVLLAVLLLAFFWRRRSRKRLLEKKSTFLELDSHQRSAGTIHEKDARESPSELTDSGRHELRDPRNEAILRYELES